MAGYRQQLEQMLSCENRERVSVVGLGSMGKTQIALELAYRVQQMELQNMLARHSVFWMQAQSMAAFHKTAGKLVQWLNIPCDDGDPRKALRIYLESDAAGYWLLILDNVDDIAELDAMSEQSVGLLHFFPLNSKGRLLITARQASVAVDATGGDVIELSSMTIDEAKKLLETLLLDKSQVKDTTNTADLIEKLTCLPLTLDDPPSRTLGWKCTSWDDGAKKCRINSKTGKESWVECKGAMDGKRCTFSQLLNFIGGISANDQLVADNGGNVLGLKATDPDPQETAKRVYAHFLAAPKPKVPDYQPYRILYQATSDYVDCINKVGNIVVKAGADGKDTGKNEKLFERFAETTKQIETARVGDHGTCLINAAEKELNPQGIDVKTESVGPGHNPGDPSQSWNTVNWEDTMAGAVDSGDFSQQEMLVIADKTREDFYAKDKIAADHRVVMQSFSLVEKMTQRCT